MRMYLEFITNQIKKKNVHTLQSAVKKMLKNLKCPIYTEHSE